MRLVIVDDEPLARSRLRFLLAANSDVEVIGEAANVHDAAVMVRETAPDVLLLDIEMRPGNGFDVLESLGSHTPAVVIFTTAHSEFAPQAFDVNATDFLVKPFDSGRVQRALDRARRTLRGAPVATMPAGAAGRWRDRVAVRLRNQIVFVKTAELIWIGAEGNYARLYTEHGSFIIREALRSLEETLDPRSFVRVHRSAIVSIDRIEKIVVGPDDSHMIQLAGGTSIPLGGNYRRRLETLMGAKL